MTLKQLQYFMAVARTLSFTEAAQQQFVSQPALSRSIAALETELQVSLLTRDHHSVNLTPAGNLLASELPKLKRELDNLCVLVRQTDDGIMGRLNIGILDGQQMDEAILVTFKYFSQSVPLIDLAPLRMDYPELVEGLVRDKLDLIVTMDFGLSEMAGLDVMVLDTIPACALMLADHPLASHETASLAEFANETFVVAANGDRSTDAGLLVEACRRAGFEPKVKAVPDTRTRLLWIESGMAISIVNAKNRACSAEGLRAVTLTDVPVGHLVLAWKHETTNPSVRLFTHITECCQ